MFVEIQEPVQHLLCVQSHERLGQLAELLDNVRQRSVLDQLQDDIQRLLGLVILYVLYNVLMVELLEQIDFALYRG